MATGTVFDIESSVFEKALEFSGRIQRVMVRRNKPSEVLEKTFRRDRQATQNESPHNRIRLEPAAVKVHCKVQR